MIFGNHPDEPDWEDEFDDSDSLDSWGHAHSPDADDHWAWEAWGDLTLFRPEGYEPGYAYPLVLWLTSDTTPGVTLRDWFPDLSDRNYLGAELSTAGSGLLTARIRSAIHEITRFYQIHPQRIWLAGRGVAADAVLQALPHLCQQLRGAIALHPTAPLPAIERASSAAGRSALYVAVTGTREVEAEQVSAAWRDAGGDCRCVLTVPHDEDERLAICHDLNKWLMNQVVTPTGQSRS